ncbi:MAG: SDR family oxidoreductase [Acidimicrobiales bacterium]|nr:SDR family oxidoreductase [Acidimicrobiales bacterium]
MTNVNGRICLVTGAASGIGRLLSFELADRGARVILWDLDADRLETVVEQVRARRGGEAWGFRCDVTDRAMVQRVADQVRAEVGDPMVVVNNAGVVSGERLVDLAPEKIERTFAVNVLALYWVTKAFLPAMLAYGEGHVVTVASAAGLVGVAKQTDYSASKHAAVGFDESLRMELRRMRSRVRTTVVCPYYIDTGMFEGVKTKVPFLLPILKQEEVARKMARAIERDRRTVVLPPFVRVVPVTRVLPVAVFDRLMDLFGVNQSMDDFVGRALERAERE